MTESDFTKKNNIEKMNFNFINKDFLKQVRRKMNGKNCTFRPLLMVLLNSKYAKHLYENNL